MLRIFNDIALSLDKSVDVILMLLDLSSAFDTVDHKILLRRLEEKFGFTEVIFKWVKSYLENRKQIVIISDVKSESYDMLYGVPQGSVLGPLLFLLYISPIQDIALSHNINIMIYADDTQLYTALRDNTDSSRILRFEACINKIFYWFRTNMLSCNANKTKLIQFSSEYKRDTSTFNISVDGHPISKINYVLDLGVILDYNLNMEKQISKLCVSASISLKKISSISKYLKRDVKERLVHAFISTKIDYCNSVLYGISDSQVQKLQRIQNAATRLVTNCRKYDHISPILNQLHWLTIKKRIIYKILLITFKSPYYQHLITFQIYLFLSKIFIGH